MDLPFGRRLFVACSALLISSCTSALAPSSLGSPFARHASSSSAHLYVVDSLTGNIYRYALSNGLPQTSPDEVFATVHDARFLGVDRKQNIYAAGSSGSTGFVEKFSADGSLLGTAQLSANVEAFATDDDGYLYVVPGNDAGPVYTYSPDAIGSGSVAQPIAILTGKQQGGGGFAATPGLTIDSNGVLYQASFHWINVFKHPRKTSKENSTIKLPRLGWAPTYDGAVALTGSGQLYANIGFGDTCEGSRRSCRPYYWFLTDFGATSGDLVRDKFQMIRSRNCFFAGSSGVRRRAHSLSGSYYYRSSGVVTGMAVYDGYIDAACTGDSTGVWVYQANDYAHQKPVEMLSGPTRPTDAKIGP